MRYDKRNETYFWIKLRQDMMHSKEIKLLMRQPDGGWYFSIYIYLIMLSMNSNGKLIQKVGDMELVYDLTTITQELMFFKIDTIRVAIEMLKSLGLLYEDKAKVICIKNFDKLVGSETGWAESKRKKKEKETLLECVENVHATFHADFPPESRVKSLEYRDKNKEIKSIDHNDRNDKYDNNDKVTFSSDLKNNQSIQNLMLNEWHVAFKEAHVFTKYLIYSKYLEEGDVDSLIAANAFFENYLKTTYEFEELKSHVQYFLYQYRKLSARDKNKIQNRLGYLTNAIKQNQRSIEWLQSDEYKKLTDIDNIVDKQLKKDAKEEFPNDDIRQELFCKEYYMSYFQKETKRIRSSFDRNCSVRK